MSREELVGAYVDGGLSRRMFIRGLVALGVSAGAAVTYADVLSAKTEPPVTSAADLYDHYPDDPADPNVGAGQAGQSGAATPVPADPSFTG